MWWGYTLTSTAMYAKHSINNYTYFCVCVYGLALLFCKVMSILVFQCMLKKVGTWNFDIFLFDRLTNGKEFMKHVLLPSAVRKL